MTAGLVRSVRGGGHALLSPALVLIVASTFALAGTASFADGGGDHQDVSVESEGEPEPESDFESDSEHESDSESDETNGTLTEEDASLESVESEDGTGSDESAGPAPSEDSEDAQASDGAEDSGTSDEPAPEPDGEGDDADRHEDEVADDVDSGDTEREIGPDDGPHGSDGSDAPTDDAEDAHEVDDADHADDADESGYAHEADGADESDESSESAALGVTIDESSVPLTVTLSGPDVVFRVVGDGTIPEDAPLAPQHSGQTLNFSNATNCPAVISIVHGRDLDLGPYALRIRYLADPEATDVPTVLLAGVRDEDALVPFLDVAAGGEGHTGFEKPLEFRLLSAHEGSLPESTTRFSPGDSVTLSMRFVIEAAACDVGS